MMRDGSHTGAVRGPACMPAPHLVPQEDARLVRTLAAHGGHLGPQRSGLMRRAQARPSCRPLLQGLLAAAGALAVLGALLHSWDGLRCASTAAPEPAAASSRADALCGGAASVPQPEDALANSARRLRDSVARAFKPYERGFTLEDVLATSEALGINGLGDTRVWVEVRALGGTTVITLAIQNLHLMHLDPCMRAMPRPHMHAPGSSCMPAAARPAGPQPDAGVPPPRRRRVHVFLQRPGRHPEGRAGAGHAQRAAAPARGAAPALKRSRPSRPVDHGEGALEGQTQGGLGAVAGHGRCWPAVAMHRSLQDLPATPCPALLCMRRMSARIPAQRRC